MQEKWHSKDPHFKVQTESLVYKKALVIIYFIKVFLTFLQLLCGFYKNLR